MEDRTQFTMRINTELWIKLKQIAEANKRSATKQVEFIIDEFVKNYFK